MNKLTLFNDIGSLYGVGEKFAGYLKKMGVKTIWDAISLVPRDYSFSKYGTAAELSGTNGAIAIKVVDKSYGKRPAKIMCEGDDGTNIMLLFFNPSYYTKKLLPGTKWIAKGEIVSHGFMYQINHPEIIPYSAKYSPHQAVYSLSSGVSLKQLSHIIEKAIVHVPDVQEWIPCEIMLEKQWPSFRGAIVKMHSPRTLSDISHESVHISRLAFDELLAQQIAFIRERERYNNFRATPCASSGDHILKFLDACGFTLSKEQEDTWQEIQQDMAKDTPMVRLLHGEVGSGKTVLAVLSALCAIESGMQATILAPTEILASQHFKFISDVVPWIRAEIFLGKRKKQYDGIISGETQLAIGTHALFQDNVAFKNLGVAVIDEQHRFGVEQRLRLIQKGVSPHVLLLSATPIPRTLETAMYGNVSVSRLYQRISKHNVKTYLINEKRIDEVEAWILKCIERGERVYWVCPIIDDMEKNSVMARAQKLSEKFGDRVGVLHGKMRPDEKVAVMNAFRAGVTPIIVSTTVIEVGVHVDEASTMIIEQSERFGLSQLHQLRGRVGRGGVPGHCFLLYSFRMSPIARERLSVMRDFSDGFEIAERDWRIRGGGDIIGTKQSGVVDYKFADLAHHIDLLHLARSVAAGLDAHPMANFLLRLFSRDYDGIMYV